MIPRQLWGPYQQVEEKEGKTRELTQRGHRRQLEARGRERSGGWETHKDTCSGMVTGVCEEQ